MQQFGPVYCGAALMLFASVGGLTDTCCLVLLMQAGTIRKNGECLVCCQLKLGEPEVCAVCNKLLLLMLPLDWLLVCTVLLVPDLKHVYLYVVYLQASS
jgi:hypothetical protein